MSGLVWKLNDYRPLRQFPFSPTGVALPLVRSPHTSAQSGGGSASLTIVDTIVFPKLVAITLVLGLSYSLPGSACQRTLKQTVEVP